VRYDTATVSIPGMERVCKRIGDTAMEAGKYFASFRYDQVREKEPGDIEREIKGYLLALRSTADGERLFDDLVSEF